VSTFAVETVKLRHQFAGGAPVLTDVDLQVPAASIYGFLGPNGAGKTTTLRLLLGLLRCQSGRISVLGHAMPTERTAILRKTGSLIESPSIYAQLSATENLRVWQVLYGCPSQRIGEVLSLVGLGSVGGKPAGKFSLGMRQRLGVAIALLHSPSLLILDEPTNGLDPHGIVEMRELLTVLNREHGITVLVSSHLLSEVEKLVTHVGVIAAGRLVFQGALPTLAAFGTSATRTVVGCTAPERALRILEQRGVRAWIEDDRLCTSVVEPDALASLNHLLVHNDVNVFSISSERIDLEAIFMKLVRS
jgi:lantibiotic transport system ATP-binding protein